MSRPESDPTDSTPAATPATAARAPQSIWGAVGGLLQAQRQSAPLRRVPRDRPLPLSEAQQRLWFIQQTDPESVTYQLNTAWRLTGPLNIAAFSRSLDAFVQRHEIYRTTFAATDGLPAQVIHKPWSLEVPLVDLGLLPATEREAEYERRSAVELRVPFDLARLPLVRATIYRFSDTEHVLLWRVHHIVFDGWSRIIFCREVEAFYKAFVANQPVRLPELPVQYADYAAWQTEWLASDQLESQMTYWRRQLAGRLPVLELPTDHPRPSVLSSRGAYVHFSFSGEVLAALSALKKQEGATSFVILFAVYQTLLHRYTGQEDLLVGVPTAGRNRSELRNLSGFFVNTQVFRGRVSGTMTFRELLAQVKEVSLAAYTHQDVSFEKLVQELRPERDRSHGALFQVMFAFINMPRGNLTLPGVTSTSQEVNAGTSKFDLSMEMIEWPESIEGFIEYSTDLFAEVTIRRWLGHFETLLLAAAAQPEQRLGELPLLTPAERRQLLEEWNDKPVDYPREVCLHQLIAVQVARTPEAVAVTFGETSLTYRELDRRANQLAQHLVQRGVGPDALVGICVERSLEMVVGLLGILKAGGAYVPLDPDYPPDRLAFMLADASVPVLLTQERLLSDLPPCSAATLCLDRDWPVIAQASDMAPVTAVGATHLAYMIYTSGSTGKPKGALNAHRGIVNRLLWMQDEYHLTAADSVLQKTPFSFDVSVWEFFWPLLTGARLVVAAPGGHQDAAYLVNLIAAQHITVLHFVPPMLRVFLEEPGLERCRSLRHVICSGEALPYDLQENFFARMAAAELHNLYGPTEAAVDVTYWACERQSERKCVPIGRPVANTQTYILDARLQPVPVGVPGELHLGGVQIGRGYHNRPELTREKFIPDPFRREPGARLYKTGDLCRHLADGAIEYLGRLDHQVKIRGFRIELGEIEAGIAQHPNVKEVVVVAREDRPGVKRLVAYLAVRETAGFSVGELRQSLKERLPEYMVPAAWVTLTQLPLSPNGKVDRKALPAPEAGPAEMAPQRVAPRTAAEQKLVEIWQTLLRVKEVGVTDNFFELGGDSILVIQIISRARQAGLQFVPKQFFQHQTIEALAAVASAVAAASTDQGLVTGVVPLTPIQHWFFELNLRDAHHWNQAFLLELLERPNTDWLREAVRQLIAHHDALRLRFARTGAGWGQEYGAASETIPFSCVNLAEVPASEQAGALTAAATELQASLDLATGPLLRVAYFDLGAAQPGRLFLAVHHLVMDGVSWRTLLEDLSATYLQLRAGQAVRLPPKTSSFKRWAEGLVELARSGALEDEVAYWLNRPATAPSPLPSDAEPVGENTGASAKTVVVTLTAAETEDLLRKVPSAYNTQINDILLTALLLTFQKRTGMESLLLQLEGHGREELAGDVDVARTVGWFTSLFPLHLQAPVSAGPGNALKSVKDQLRRIPGKGRGYGLLRYLTGEAATSRKLRALPQPELLFNYLGQFDQMLAGESLFRLAPASTGLDHSPRGERISRVEIVARVVGEQLQVRWIFSESLHRQETVEQVARDYVVALRELITHCLSAGAGGHTPSDFALAGLSQAGLDELCSKLAEANKDSGNFGKSNLEDIYPLTPTQEGILFHCGLAPGSGLYWTQFTMAIRGGLDTNLFRRAWEETANRHPGLRSAFAWEKQERPLQIVRRHVTFPWTQLDWTGLSSMEQTERFEQFLREDRAEGCELSQGPLLRFALLRLSADQHRFVWSSHHLLLDGWSLQMILNEALNTYDQMVRGEALRRERSYPFRSYVEWLLQQKHTAAEKYFRSHLAGMTTPTPLIVAGVTSADGRTTAESADEYVTISRSETARLTAFARAQRLTLNTVLQAAWGLLLHRYSGESDVMFGVTFSGRSAPVEGVEAIAGLFINTLPVRFKIKPDEPAGEWLQSVQQVQVELQQFQHTPLVEVQGWSEIRRGEPLFNSIFVFENYPIATGWEERASGLSLSEVRGVERNNYPLSIAIHGGEEIVLRALYDTSRFETGTIQRMLGHFRCLLEGIVIDPTCLIGRLPMLTPAERRQLLEEWNDTTTQPVPAHCLHEMFEAQAARTPEAVAVVYENQSVSYGELNRRANQLARHLARLGVGPEALVGLFLERSVEMVVALFGVLKAGAAYVPLDPGYPPDRVAYMLGDARMPVLLTQAELTSRLPAHSAKVVCLDADWPSIASQSWENPALPVAPENLAYVIYTSGSTGRPKGAGIPHRAICNHMSWMQRVFPLTPADAVLQKTPFSFDASVWEFYAPLLVGGRLIIARPGGHADSAYLTEAVQQHRVTTLQLVPSVLRVLTEEARFANCKTLRRVFCGGEALAPDLVEDFVLRLPTASLHNLYGPTEAAIDSTAWTCQPGGHTAGVPIGRPVDNAQTYVVDGNLQPVPVGVAGELLIGGAGLARGYVGSPDLTAEKFISNPFGGESGSRLYRTGDLVRYAPGGELLYLGRIDHQVKIRGFRIETGEVEAALALHPEVREVVVTAREDRPGTQQLVAYLVNRRSPGPSVADLRDHLKARLPEYMVPAAFVTLERMPLLPNGKVNRKELPAPETSPAETAQTLMAPRTPVESELVKIWMELLAVPGVGVNDNFFDLGGHSLLALRLFSKIHSGLGVRLSVRVLFEAPTIAGLAARIEAERDAIAPPVGTLERVWEFITPIQPRGQRRPFYLVPGGLGGEQEFLVYARLARHLEADQPFYGLKARGADGKQAPHESVVEMASNYVREIRAFQPAGPYLLVGECLGGIVAFEMARQLEASGQAVGMLVLLDSLCPNPLGYLCWHVHTFWESLGPRFRASLPVRLFHHLRELPRIPAGERLDYIRGQSKKALARLHALPAPPSEGAEANQLAPGAAAERGVANYPKVLVRYRPKKYGGKLDLVVSDGMPLKGLVLAWTRYTSGGHSVHRVPGDHLTYIREHVREAADKLRLCLERATSANDKR